MLTGSIVLIQGRHRERSVSPRSSDQRTTHPERQSHQQHLYRPGKCHIQCCEELTHSLSHFLFQSPPTGEHVGSYRPGSLVLYVTWSCFLHRAAFLCHVVLYGIAFLCLWHCLGIHFGISNKTIKSTTLGLEKWLHS